jgi:adenylate cyclase
MTPTAGSGAQDPLTLSFLDRDLEGLYQRAAGAESLNGLRAIALASGVIWVLAAFIVPIATSLSPTFTVVAAEAMALVSFVVVALSLWAPTLDRQHALASLLTSANGIVIFALALVADFLPGYGVAAATLLFIWGFVSRTRFVYAALRTAVVSLTFLAAVTLYRGPTNLLLDVLFFVAAAVGTLVALRILERNRRRLFFQELIIRGQSEQLAAEMAKSEQLILNILPASIATRLRNGEGTIADDYPSVTVLFADIVGFTPLSARLTAHELIDLLSRLFSRFDELVADRGLEKIKTIGDNYMAVGGLSNEIDHAADVVRLGLAMLEEAHSHEALGQPLDLRIGIHSGPVAGGVIGTRKLAFDLWGDTVNVASRLQELSSPGRVHLSEATWLLVRDSFDCEPLGESQLRGHAGMNTYVVIGPKQARQTAASPS